MASGGPGDVVIGGLGLLCFGAWTFYTGFQEWKKKNHILNTPTSKIRGLAMGACEIHGHIKPLHKTLIDPLTKKECVWYDYQVLKLVKRGKSSSWVPVVTLKDGVPFKVKDDTGEVLVNAEKLEFRFKPDFEKQSKGFDSFSPALQALLTSQGVKPAEKILFFEGKLLLRVVSRHLAIGAEVYILGEAVDNPLIEEGTAQGNEDLMIVGSKEFNILSKGSEKEALKEASSNVFYKLGGGVLLMLAGVGLLVYYFKIE